MKHSYLLHAGCLLAATLVISGCTAGHHWVGPVKQTKTPTVKKAAVTPEKKAVNNPSGKQAAVKPKRVSKPVAKQTPAPVAAKPAAENPLEHYRVTVIPNKTEVAVGESLSLRVSVEAPGFPTSDNMAHGIKINFSGLDFAEEAPAVECLRAHPNGSEVYYTVTAAKAGSFDAAADVSVFPTRTCSTLCPAKKVKKSSAPVKITVR